MSMTAVQKRYGPFAHPAPPGWGIDHTQTCDAKDRITMVRESCDADWLEAVIAHPHTQKTVRHAAKRRLRWVLKAVNQLRQQASA